MADNSKKGGGVGGFLDSMTPLGKTIVGVIGAVVVVGIIWEVYTYFTKKSALQPQQQAVCDASQDLQKLSSQGMNPSFVGSQYATWATALQEAMNGCGQPNYEQTIISIFQQMQNTADVLMLINAFGVQTLNPCWETHPVNQIESWFSTTQFSGNLQWWLEQCLSPADFATINANFLAQGINYTFQ